MSNIWLNDFVLPQRDGSFLVLDSSIKNGLFEWSNFLQEDSQMIKAPPSNGNHYILDKDEKGKWRLTPRPKEE